MRVLQLTRLEGPDGLELAEVPIPHDPEAVIIDVHAAGVAFSDLLRTRGGYQDRPELPYVPGWDIAGVVRSAPDDSGFRPGDRVAASTASAWAEVAAAPPSSTFTIPDDMSFEQAVSLGNYLTSYFGLLIRGGLRPGERVLVHGAAGGIGTASVQVARGLGADVIGVALGEEKRAVAERAGAHHTLDASGDWLSGARSLTDGRGVEVVFDPVGGERFTDSLRALAPGGRLLVIGFAGGAIPQVKVNRLLLNNISVVGVSYPDWLRTHPELPAIIGAGLRALWDGGHVRPIAGQVFPLERGADALRAIEERRAVGKIVLRVGS
jgi:NADPH2:quinone reductase